MTKTSELIPHTVGNCGQM